MNKHEARHKGLRLAARITGIGAIVIAATALAETQAAATSTSTSNDADDAVKDALKVEPRSGGCGCAPCWGPPAPPVLGAFS